MPALYQTDYFSDILSLPNPHLPPQREGSGCICRTLHPLHRVVSLVGIVPQSKLVFPILLECSKDLVRWMISVVLDDVQTHGKTMIVVELLSYSEAPIKTGLALC